MTPKPVEPIFEHVGVWPALLSGVSLIDLLFSNRYASRIPLFPIAAVMYACHLRDNIRRDHPGYLPI